MAGNDSGKTGMLGVLLGALIVIAVGGGILYATGIVGGEPKATTVNVQMPKPETQGQASDRDQRDARDHQNWRDRHDSWRDHGPDRTDGRDGHNDRDGRRNQ